MKRIPFIAIQFTFFLTAISSVAFSENTEHKKSNFELVVSVSEYSSSGGSHDGMRLYILPWETTTSNPPDIAVCIVGRDGSSNCYHRTLSDGTVGSICPDSPRCSFNVRWPEDGFAGIAIFDIDSFGQSTVDEAANKIRSWFGGKLQSLDNSINAVSEANQRRFSWIENAIMFPYEIGLTDSDRRMLSEHLMDLVESKSPPQFSDIRRGRLSAPIEAIPIENCEDPAPPCEMNYASIQIINGEL
ncbi:hypothetical protein [Stappia sp.]|uniref:hypothetical protein n=1 Tax=Stappia sp. TaxID=1870903 RepID=UPI003C79C3B8